MSILPRRHEGTKKGTVKGSEFTVAEFTVETTLNVEPLNL
jgi:hypothetical protein